MSVITRREARDATEGAGLGFIAVIVVGILALAAAAFFWWISVATSGIKGAGDVIKQNNDANNRIAAQSEFNKLWSDIQGYNANIAAAAAALATNPNDTYQQSVLTAEQQICRSAVQQYNADTLNVTMKDWRPAEDPASIDPTAECEAAV